MYFLIPVALFALCLVHGIVRAVQDVRRDRLAIFWDVWHLRVREALEQIEKEVLAEFPSPFRHGFVADNRQGIPLATSPGEWIDSRGNPQPFKSVVPEHLRGSMELILDRPPREEVDWVVTRAAFKITKHDPEPRAFLLKDIVT